MDLERRRIFTTVRSAWRRRSDVSFDMMEVDTPKIVSQDQFRENKGGLYILLLQMEEKPKVSMSVHPHNWFTKKKN
jgi:hypothetical protein